MNNEMIRPSHERIYDFTRQNNADYWTIIGDLMTDSYWTFTLSRKWSEFLIGNSDDSINPNKPIEPR